MPWMVEIRIKDDFVSGTNSNIVSLWCLIDIYKECNIMLGFTFSVGDITRAFYN